MGKIVFNSITPVAGKIKLGSQNVNKIYVGGIQIFPNEPYVFQNRGELDTAIDLWTGTSSERLQALNTYGDINTWVFAPTLTDMSFLFHLKTFFNSDISNWDMSNVIDTSSMFHEANDFNQDISSWDVSNVTSMNNMFIRANAFNQDIGSWDVSSVTNMSFMFYEASSFNQNLSGWCVTNITSEPSNFSTASPLIPANKPVWGTCPGA